MTWLGRVTASLMCFTTGRRLVETLDHRRTAELSLGLGEGAGGRAFCKFNDEVLLVGNFGDGQINAYDVRNGTPLQGGPLLHREDQPLQFNGLWALFFFDRKLYFTAGIADEAHGLFGVIHKEEHEDSDD